MRIASVLLRVLLCLGLVAGGVASARADAAMRLAAVDARVAVDPVDATAAHGDCHAPESVAAPTGDRAGNGDGASCCDGACPCTVAMTSLVLDAPPMRLDVRTAGLDASTDSAGHRPPRLPDRIRPPIG